MNKEQYNIYYDYNYNPYSDTHSMKANNSTMKNNYCFRANNYYLNCSETIHNIKNWTDIFNCTKCFKNNELTKMEEILKEKKLKIVSNIQK